MNMPFPDNTFDAIYAIEATCHASDQVYFSANDCLNISYGLFYVCITPSPNTSNAFVVGIGCLL